MAQPGLCAIWLHRCLLLFKVATYPPRNAIAVVSQPRPALDLSLKLNLSLKSAATWPNLAEFSAGKKKHSRAFGLFFIAATHVPRPMRRASGARAISFTWALSAAAATPCVFASSQGAGALPAFALQPCIGIYADGTRTCTGWSAFSFVYGAVLKKATYSLNLKGKKQTRRQSDPPVPGAQGLVQDKGRWRAICVPAKSEFPP